MSENRIDDEVLDLIRAILDTEREVSLETDLLSDVELDSLAFVELIDILEDRFGLEIPPQEMVSTNFESPKSIIQLVVRLTQKESE